ncbi:hypothetical protein [Trinickia dinghuensis]|nr:hypothetical protein [Trinickia dinghuensis]
MSRGAYTISTNLLDIAKSAKQVNLAKEAREIEPRFNRQLAPLLA